MYARFWTVVISTLCLVSGAVDAIAQHSAPTTQDITDTDPAAAIKSERQLVSKVRQLTFEGRRAGEGYFGANGRLMVFQSEREPGNPFFQIYLMDLETGDTNRISPGSGKTTCAWIHPTGESVLFSSTHEDAAAKTKQQEELDLRASGKQRRYSWDYDATYDIFDYDRKAKTYTNLTKAEGYDAEGSWSPDGKLIAFASNRTAYNNTMTAAEKIKFDIDPAFMNEIYLMNADGSNVRRLTTTPGYDGGPFFSPDGKHICWRRFTEDGATAEIMTMDVDGTNQKKLTSLGAMSWAPYYHPSGDYLIFTTNKHGFANFELYMISVDGKSGPVRVTYTPGFDGLPVFTPDGNKLSWTTNRTSEKQSQIFMGKWDHAKALELLKVAGAQQQESIDTASARTAAATSKKSARPEFAPADMVRHVEYLCRPELKGRMTGSAGEKLATEYVASYFESLGLQPAGDNGTWYQKFEFTSGVSLGKKNSLAVADKTLTVDEDWRPVAFSASGEVAKSQVVFAGYGIVAPKADGFDEYDSFVHLDVKDKWVLVFRYMPEDITAEHRQHFSRHTSLRYKSMQIRDKGARGMIVVSGPTSKVDSELVAMRFDNSVGGSLPVISITDKVAMAWLKTNDKSLLNLQTKLDSGDPMMGFAIEGIEVSATIDIEQVRRGGRNVLGRLDLAKDPAAQTIVVGAHIDHLGKGPAAGTGSLAKPEERDGIHFGADDNASGVAAMLEIAEYLSNRELPNAHRDVIFAAWSGEELGLIGSNHFVKNYMQSNGHGHAHGGSPHNPHAVDPHANPHAVNPHAANPHTVNPHATNPDSAHANPHAAPGKSKLKDKTGKQKEKAKTDPHSDPHSDPHANPHANPHAAPTDDPHAGSHGGLGMTVGPLKSPSLYPTIAACINMDMVGRLEKNLVVQGVGSSSIWKSEIERRNAPVGLPLTLQNDSYLPTDAKEFFIAGVPILSAFTGNHKDYHTPRDTPNKLNYQGAADIAKFMGLITRSLVLRSDTPDYIAQSGPKDKQIRANMRAYLGTIPDYATEVKGVLLSGASKGAPADKAGLKGGDIIVELAGRKIENIYDYTYAIEALKIGQEVAITVKRDGKDVKLKITPGSRD